MKTLPSLLVCLVLGSPAWGALGYSRFVHPLGDYVLEYPSEWKRSLGLQSVWLTPPGRDARQVRFSLELYPLGRNSPATPDEFIAGLMEVVGKIKKLDSDSEVRLAGRKVRRIALTETVELKGDHGETLPGPARELYLIVALKKGYYVLKLAGVGEAFDKSLPEFERIAKRLKFEAKPPPR